MKTIIAAHVYPGWHVCAERNKALSPDFNEWELVINAPKRFSEHYQPRIPLNGIYDDSKAQTALQQIELAKQYGVDMFVYGFFWSRGKRVLNKALDNGFLGMNGEHKFPFSVMWANRMPRGILPIKLKHGPEIEPGRLVYTDPEDFMELIVFLEENYFRKENYFRINNKPLFSIFDTTFFINQLGKNMVSEVINQADQYLISKGYAGIHLMAINAAPSVIRDLGNIGFKSHSHYVWLPDWKGEYLQDYKELTIKRTTEWFNFAKDAAISYFPSVSPGWDATPRGSIHGKPKTQKYPWWPIVVNTNPQLFQDFLKKAIDFSQKNNEPSIVFVASWNEWSEGHYLEPDEHYGTAWLEAVREAKLNE